MAFGNDQSDVAGIILLKGNPADWSASTVEQLQLGRPLFNGGDLNGLVCRSLSSCVAVGEDDDSQPLVLRGNPNTLGGSDAKRFPAAHSTLFGVTCTSVIRCVAGGAAFDATDGSEQPFVLQGDPATWTARDAKKITLGRALGSEGALNAVKCTTMTSCVAVGWDGTTSGFLWFSGNPAAWTAADAR